uniref:Uncharacterized protein n=1 Tax=Dulem virus 38 TaxID=3145756 RepID=A0AAU8B0G1_9CAUD
MSIVSSQKSGNRLETLRIPRSAETVITLIYHNYLQHR